MKIVNMPKKNRLWEKFGKTCLNITNAGDMLQLNIEAMNLILDDAAASIRVIKEDDDLFTAGDEDSEKYYYVLQELGFKCREEVEKLMKGSKEFREIIGDPEQTQGGTYGKAKG